MPQSEHVSFTETLRTNYPPAWDTTVGPTVTRTVTGTVPNYAVPWAVPVQQIESGGADVSPMLVGIRERYRQIAEEPRIYPMAFSTGSSVGTLVGAPPRAEKAAQPFNYAEVVLLGLVVGLAAGFFVHWLTSRAERARRVARRRRRRDRAEAGRTQPAVGWRRSGA